MAKCCQFPRPVMGSRAGFHANEAWFQPGEEHQNLRPPHTAIVESAFVAGIKEMTLAGLGVAWLAVSLIHAEVQSGALAGCNAADETVPSRITLCARPSDESAAGLCALR